MPYNGSESNMKDSDYEIRWFNTIADTSVLGNATAPFEIWDVTPGRLPFKKDIAVLDYKVRNNTWDLGEDIVIVEPGEGLNVSWQITFEQASSGETVDPIEGDIFYIATNRPFNEKDVFRYRTFASKIDDENLVPQNWTSLEILKAEKEVLGYFLSGHPLDENLSLVRSLCSHVISNISSGKCRLVGLISSFRIIDTRRGKLALIELDDKTGTIEVAISEDEYNKYIDSIIVDDIVVVEGAINKEQAGRPPSVRANYIESMDLSLIHI